MRKIGYRSEFFIFFYFMLVRIIIQHGVCIMMRTDSGGCRCVTVPIMKLYHADRTGTQRKLDGLASVPTDGLSWQLKSIFFNGFSEQRKKKINSANPVQFLTSGGGGV